MNQKIPNAVIGNIHNVKVIKKLSVTQAMPINFIRQNIMVGIIKYDTNLGKK